MLSFPFDVQLRARLCSPTVNWAAAAAQVRADLALSAWNLHAQMAHAYEYGLPEDLWPLNKSMEYWAGLLLDSAEERRMQGWMHSPAAGQSQAEEYDAKKTALKKVMILLLQPPWECHPPRDVIAKTSTGREES